MQRLEPVAFGLEVVAAVLSAAVANPLAVGAVGPDGAFTEPVIGDQRARCHEAVLSAVGTACLR